MNVHFTIACVFPERDVSFVLRFGDTFIHLTAYVKRNIRSRLIARCFGFPLHNFLTGSDSQKFRVSAYSRDRLIGE